MKSGNAEMLKAETLKEEPKPWWQSRTILGAVIVLVSSVAGIFGWSVDSEATTEIALEVASVVGAVLAIYGRVRAERPIRPVRRAVAVETRDEFRYRNPKTGGYSRGGALVVCSGLFAAGMYIAHLTDQWRVNRYEDEALPNVITTMPVIQTNAPAQDARPFAPRLMGSIHAVPQVRQVGTNAPVVHGITITGGAEF